MSLCCHIPTDVCASYAYDHRGRMVRKDIQRRDAEPQDISYLWDNWNIVRETRVSGLASQVSSPVSDVTYNVWGLDLDGTLQGAGGVGGLLAVIRDDGAYLPTYDANGNISEYVSATDGTIAAHYDYSPFGETLVSSGPLADSFTHSFGTKPWCADTRLNEYQMRKYRPSIGRWMSRDPIGINGGHNPHAFILNRASMSFDDNGRAPRYVYPGVTLTIDLGTWDGEIVPSPDIDWGSWDSEFGGVGPGTGDYLLDSIKRMQQLVMGMAVGLEVQERFRQMIEEFDCCSPSGPCSIDNYDGVIEGNNNSWTIAHRITGCRLKAIGMDRDNVILLNSLHETFEFFRPWGPEFLAFIEWDGISGHHDFIEGVAGSLQAYLVDTISDIQAVMEGFNTNGSDCYNRFIPTECHRKKVP